MLNQPNTDSAKHHQALLDQLKQKGHLANPAIEAAFRAIPRHPFLPHLPLEEVYQDRAIMTKRVDDLPLSSSSQPSMMAIMLAQLDLQPGHRVLEIGAGTGYNAALMAYMVGETGQVVTVDIDQDLVDGAKAHLAALNHEQVQVVCADGGYGFAEAAPYDRIILTVGVDDVTPAWLEQLKPGGLILLPLAMRDIQISVVFRQVEHYLNSLSVSLCGFIRLRGDFAASAHDSGRRSGFQGVQLGPEEGIWLLAHDIGPQQAQNLYLALTGPSQDWPVGVRLSRQEFQQQRSLSFWGQLQSEQSCVLVAYGPMADRGIVPYLFGEAGKQCCSSGLFDQDSLALLINPDEQSPPHHPQPASTMFEPQVRSFGPNQALAQTLVHHIQSWDAAGRPSVDQVKLRLYPKAVDYQPQLGEFVIPKRWTRLVVAWS